jgi:hydroxymethylpyrimidine/phosphomethylpyrimidine kinase
MAHEILCIGMSDSSAGTGIQADIKTIQALGGYAATVVTAVAVQNTVDVFDIFPIPVAVVKAQLKAVMDDLQPRVIKTGMLVNEDTINAIGDFLDSHKDLDLKYVVDPVITGRVGKTLLDKAARDALKRRLLIHADFLTPNIHEAESLTGLSIRDVDSMKHAAEMLITLGVKNIVVKGGGLVSDKILNVFADENGVEVFEQPRFDSRATHGAGTTLSSAIACMLSQNHTPREAFTHAQEFLMGAIKAADVIGSGFGPVNHAYRMRV